RLGTGDQRPPAALLLRLAAQSAPLAGDGLEVREIRARAERAAGAGDDHDARGRVGARALDRLDELAEHRVGHRVALLGALEGDRADLVLDLVADVARHASLLR